MRCSPLRIQYDVILVGGMYVLAGLADADIGLHHHKAIHFAKGIHSATVGVLYQPGFGKRIGEVNLQVTRLDILDGMLHNRHELIHLQVTHFIQQEPTKQVCERFARGSIVCMGFLDL